MGGLMVYLMLHVWIEKSKFGEEMGWIMTCILSVLVGLLWLLRYDFAVVVW